VNDDPITLRAAGGAPAIEARGLTRHYGPKPVVLDLDLTVPRGSVFALLGRNGSGKTTTIRMLLGLLAPTRGSSTVLGRDSMSLRPEDRARIGYLAEGHFAHGWMRVRECAKFQEACFPRWSTRIFDSVAAHFALDPAARVRSLSRGERAGLCLALTLAPEPELLVLDDPALGLDPVARRSLLEALLSVTRAGDRTVLLSSHLLDDVERVADHIAIIDRGVIRVHAPVETFRERVGRWVLRFDRPPARLPDVPRLVQSRAFEGELQLTIAHPDAATDAALAGLGAASIERAPLSLEDAVIDYLRGPPRAVSLLGEIGGAP
jgi:ABC-2 type transport system ATP-binding protein